MSCPHSFTPPVLSPKSSCLDFYVWRGGALAQPLA